MEMANTAHSAGSHPHFISQFSVLLSLVLFEHVLFCLNFALILSTCAATSKNSSADVSALGILAFHTWMFLEN